MATVCWILWCTILHATAQCVLTNELQRRRRKIEARMQRQQEKPHIAPLPFMTRLEMEEEHHKEKQHELWQRYYGSDATVSRREERQAVEIIQRAAEDAGVSMASPVPSDPQLRDAAIDAVLQDESVRLCKLWHALLFERSSSNASRSTELNICCGALQRSQFWCPSPGGCACANAEHSSYIVMLAAHVAKTL